MKRQFLAVTLMAALAAVPVRADDSLLYLAGRPVDSQMGSDQLRHRLKDFLSRRTTVSAPIRRVERTHDVAALSVEIPVSRETTANAHLDVAHPHKEAVPTSSEIMQPPEEIVLPPEVLVAALTLDDFDAPIPVQNDRGPREVVPGGNVAVHVPEEIVLPPEVLVAALTADAFGAPVAMQDDSGPRESLLDRDIAVHVPEEVILPPEVLVAALPADAFFAPVPTIVEPEQVLDRDITVHVPEEVILPPEVLVAALPADSLAAPVSMLTDAAVIAPELDLALPAAETAVDRAQFAHFSERERAVVFRYRRRRADDAGSGAKGGIVAAGFVQ